MKDINIIGLDLAKSVFQIHGIDVDGTAVLKRKLRRSDMLTFFGKLPPCLVAMEACGGAHHWARAIAALGHEVRLIPPAYVKPFVKRGKTDAADAEAICEAVTRPSMRFVPVKTILQQSQAMVLKTRELLLRQRVQASNAIRGHLTELGIINGLGSAKVVELISIIRDESDERIPTRARLGLRVLAEQFESLKKQIEILERDIVAQARDDEAIRNLLTIPGVGPITAAAIRAHVPDIQGFKSGRHFSAWLGLTPKSNSSGGKDRLGRISKMGNRALRTLLVLGSTCLMRHARNGAPSSKWLNALTARRPFRVAAVAIANKTARIIWAILIKGSTYRKPSSDVAISAC